MHKQYTHDRMVNSHFYQVKFFKFLLYTIYIYLCALRQIEDLHW